jgi:hypothetical protein
MLQRQLDARLRQVIKNWQTTEIKLCCGKRDCVQVGTLEHYLPEPGIHPPHRIHWLPDFRIESGGTILMTTIKQQKSNRRNAKRTMDRTPRTDNAPPHGSHTSTASSGGARTDENSPLAPSVELSLTEPGVNGSVEQGSQIPHSESGGGIARCTFQAGIHWPVSKIWRSSWTSPITRSMV